MIKKMLQNKIDDETPITMVTAYDFPSSKVCESAGADLILVGDSVGMVMLGYSSTIKVTVDDMIHHGKAVRRGAPNTHTIVDMPFMSFNISVEDTLRDAKRMFQEIEPDALKIEGGQELVPTVTKLTQAGIPVVGHIGLTPQTVNVLGGYRVQGRSEAEAKQLIEDAKALEDAGAIAIVLECVPAPLATKLTEELAIPTIGIGAGNQCDGQVLVYHDLLQYGVSRLPKFVQAYANLDEVAVEAVSQYVLDVKEKNFPTDDHAYKMNDDVLKGLYGGS
ncbi:3-methyl-2-oxobutanoate hydroxymethyltransferase [Alkalibacillus flavidus]|uniref:3-methyl-2-oxobutanoate hydroxymethyltransferase n=1 Tax=Alkalibacillus flavidus TaxID=546021 RepID=A0ABV2KUN3_9BACI